jgi:hypothetical protein
MRRLGVVLRVAQLLLLALQVLLLDVVLQRIQFEFTTISDETEEWLACVAAIGMRGGIPNPAAALSDEPMAAWIGIWPRGMAMPTPCGYPECGCCWYA